MTTWSIHAPVASYEQMFLDGIQSFRGRIFYEDGLRPQFQTAQGSFVDADPLDSISYHILAHRGNDLNGCVRLTPGTNQHRGLTERCLGSTAFHEALLTLGFRADEAIESGRWCVVRNGHGLSTIGVLLAAAAVATARTLQYKCLYCSAGIKNKADQLLISVGLEPVPGLAPIPIPAFDDHIRMLYITPCSVPSAFQSLMDRMAEELELDRTLQHCQSTSLIQPISIVKTKEE